MKSLEGGSGTGPNQTRDVRSLDWLFKKRSGCTDVPTGFDLTPRGTLRQALDDPALVGTALAGPSWRAWRSLLLAAMGEPLATEELETFKQFMGRMKAPTQRADELWCCVGRRGGSRADDDWFNSLSRRASGALRKPTPLAERSRKGMRPSKWMPDW
jgi:hypothetical protein